MTSSPPLSGQDLSLSTLLKRMEDANWLPQSWSTGHTEVLWVARPAEVAAALTHPALVRLEVFTDTLGDGLLSSEGSFWKQQRKRLQPAFNAELMQRVWACTRNVLSERFTVLDEQCGEEIDLNQLLAEVALDGLCRALVGRPDDAEIGSLITTVTQMNRLSAPSIAAFFGCEWTVQPGYRQQLHAAVSKVDEFIYPQIHQRRARSGEHDILDVLLAAPELPVKLVRDELVTLMVAGHETTAVALSWAFALLDLHPEHYSPLCRQAAEVLGDRLPEVSDLTSLSCFKAVFHETLRLYPPVWLMLRRAVTDLQIAGTPVRAGTVVLVSAYHTHRYPEAWPQADEFRPERFSDDTKKRAPGSYLPFAYGRHSCIGVHVGTMQACLVLAALVCRYRIEITNRTRLEVTTTLRHDVPLRAALERRTW